MRGEGKLIFSFVIMKGRVDGLTSLLLISIGALFLCGNTWGIIDWVNHGNGILNHRSAIGPGQKITAKTVSKLTLKWRFLTGFAVSATPSVADGAVYFPGWNGMLYSLDEETGKLRWEKNLTELVGVSTGSRATPVVYKELLLVGLLGPAVVIAVNRYTGSLVWKSNPLDTAAHTVITMSGTVYEGYYYVGVSSLQEDASEYCCTFQGSFQKISLQGGNVVWSTPMLPPNSGFYGAAVWGSSPSIDEKRRLVFIATGNNYEVPKYIQDCENARSNNSIQTDVDPCEEPFDHQDSMMALNIDNGTIMWSRSLQAYDVWTYPCQVSSSTSNCPSILGQDYDFGEAPMLLHFDMVSQHKNSSEETCLVVAGQKSGVVWALSCDTGAIVWSRAAGPGGYLGGASWGSCTDGERVYTNIINNLGSNFTLAPGTNVTTGGGWVAMDARTGRVLWSTAEPSGSHAYGPVSIARGVVFGTSFTEAGDVYALDALTGAILWRNTTGASIYGGVSIARNCIYVGNGYTNLPTSGAAGTALSAFCLPAHSGA